VTLSRRLKPGKNSRYHVKLDKVRKTMCTLNERARGFQNFL